MGHMYIFIPSPLYCNDLRLLSLLLGNRLCKLLCSKSRNVTDGLGWTFFLITVVPLNFLFLVYFTIYYIFTFLSFKRCHIEITRTLILFFSYFIN